MMPATSTAITSRANPRVKQLRAAFSGNARLSDGLVGIEGEMLLREALRSGLTLMSVFLDEQSEIPAWLPRGIEVLRLTREVFAGAVDTRHPQGIAALLAPPIWKIEAAISVRNPLLLIAAGLQDPGNLGTLIRSAEAFAATAVLITPGTVTEWNQKAIRASAGSVFRVPVLETSVGRLAAMKSEGVRFFAAVADDPVNSKVLAAADVDFTTACALIIGNEGAGLGEEWLALADARITIATPGCVESLNAAVAGSLLLYEASRQRAALQSMAGNRDRQPFHEPL